MSEAAGPKAPLVVAEVAEMHRSGTSLVTRLAAARLEEAFRQCRRHVAFVESTTAWRLRAQLVRLRHGLTAAFGLLRVRPVDNKASQPGELP
jgi:hypothetical protein